MEIALNVEVHCTDGTCGRTTAVVFNPVTREMTHVAVETKGLLHDTYLVPLNKIVETTPHGVQLACSRDELAQEEPFYKVRFIGVPAEGDAAMQMDGGLMMWPYAAPDDMYLETLPPTEEVEQVPHGELAIHRGTRVEATDGSVGRVDEFVVNPDNCHISHLILRTGHFWGQKEVTIPLAQIERVEEDVVYLKLDKAAVGDLPTVPVRRE